jgi:Rps23 Pro-64 3,4-dihydroxylase Tpa1-like proline 4-hydroxylase
MKIHDVLIDNKRSIIVIDDAFNFSEISGNYAETISKQYIIFNSNELEVQNIGTKRLGCRLDLGDPLLTSIFNDRRVEVLERFIPKDQYTISRSYINLGIHSDIHKIHVDDFVSKKSITCLIYLNRNWDCDWGGETIFYDDERKDIKFISPYIPGRIIIFDGSIPHSAKPQHFNAPPYRFTLALKFVSINN